MASKKGNLSINSENMFPIIKKWLYSDHDIFYREVISNACDAITKIRKMDMMGEYTLPDGFKPRVDVVLNDKEKTIKITDNGIGMTAEEVEEYINQVAFSGATDFLNKYKDKANADQIIGHFGLGFYSTFMVSDSVDIDTLSYKSDAASVHWTCDGGSDFEMSDGDKKEVGTTITLHLSEDCLEFCNEYKAREVIEKYCSFMPYEIYLSKENEEGTETIKESEKLDSDVVIEVVEPEKKDETKADGENKDEKKEEEKKLKIKRRPQLLNDTHPLWAKTPKDCTDEEYKEFYRKVFRDYKEPLFWIHLNMDYPFNLKGILYFPKINMEFESIEGTIKLYNNQVFIADNIKEVIPEYLMLLKGVIDCPDLPLNVSRSALQNDGFVKKISEYISKKVAEKLAGLCKTDKENYDKYWDDISPFIKYGCLRDDKFCEKMTDYILFKNLDGKYLTTPEALQINKEAEEAAAKDEAVDENGNKVEAEVVGATPNEKEQVSGGDHANDSEESSKNGADDSKNQTADDNKEKEPRTIYYVTDEQQQSQYIKMFKAQKMEAFIMNHNIDVPFMQQLEAKNEGIKFARIDADLTDTFKSKTSKKAAAELEEKEKELSEKIKKALKNDKLTIKLEKLKDKKMSSMLTVSEESRRMAEMMKMYAMNGMSMGDFGNEGQTLILNANHPLVQYVMEHEDGENTNMICEQLYDLARIQNAPLEGEAMAKFIARSNDIMMVLAK
ncbi:molecular chaperone HtpG [Butyrivibrio proteoclasticus]|uniref:Molecular chaperone HtpG n=1 Tax=Butyrivibrio proteoclasticus TaxID=43305 RepID=A0A1I5Y7K2_9FIRM|nr:molecular chaperone HtpG [Butyrivibrio proteoclasticus]SFQ40188.1 molecular chaperone HtpG [Butyrivibrio proteoclasticus]